MWRDLRFTILIAGKEAKKYRDRKRFFCIGKSPLRRLSYDKDNEILLVSWHCYIVNFICKNTTWNNISTQRVTNIMNDINFRIATLCCPYFVSTLIGCNLLLWSVTRMVLYQSSPLHLVNLSVVSAQSLCYPYDPVSRKALYQAFEVLK